MAIDRNKLKQIYSTLQSGGYRQDYQTFEKGFTNKDNYATRKKTYDLLTAHGAQIGGSYEEFMKKLQVSGSHSSMRTGKSGVAGGHPLSEAEKQEMMANVTGLVENAKAGVAGAQKRIANQMAIVKKPLNASSQIGENKNVREKGYSYNPNSGKLEKTYVTTLGSEYNSRYNADQEQKQIDQLNHDSSLGGQLENAYAERERLDEALKKRRQEVDQSEGKLARFLRGLAANSSAGYGAVAYNAQEMRYNDDPEYLQLMAAARKNHQTIQLLEQKRDNKMNEFWRPALDNMTGGSLFTSGLAGLQDLIAQQEAEKHLDSINKKRAKGKKLTRDEQAAEVVLKNFATNDAMQALYGDDYGPWGRAGKTLATGLDFMYDIGISGDLGGMVTKGVSKAVVNGATKGLTKLAGKQAEKLLAKKAMQYTLKATGVGIGAHLGGLAIANTTVLPKTVGLLGSATGGHVVTDDKGSYHVVDKQRLLPALAEVERSQAREYGSEMIGEFLPVGKILKKGLEKTGLTKALEKIGLSKVSGMLTNIGTKQWYKQYSNILKAGGYNGIPGEVLEEYEGSLFDALTGHADDAWRDMTSLRTHVDIALGCASMGVVLGAVPMMGAAYHTTLYYGYKHKTDKADKVASSLVGDEKWGAIRDKIDQTENGKMTDVLVGILMDKELNDQAKNATLKYARNLTKMRMYNIVNVNCAAEESMNATPQDSHGREVAQQQDRQNGAKIIAERMNACYGMGYNATDAPSMYDAGVTLKAQENRLSKLLGVGDVRKAMGEDPMAFVEKRKQAGASAEEVQAMEDFLVADSAVKGIRQRMADNLDSRLSESDAEMEKRINTEDGMVHKAVMQVRNQDDKEHEVYVLKGNVRMNADGRGVDASSSDNEIYVYDPQEGKTRMMPPSFIERIDEPVDAETVRRAAGESIRQDYQSELAKLDTSGLSFQVGDRYDAVDERGVQHRIEVVGGAVDDAGNAMSGYVGVRVDGGEAVSMRTDEIAKMVGNADVQRREAELSGEASEDGHASDADHAVDADDVPTYAQNEVLTLLDEHGNPVRAEITAAANEDGLYEVLTDEPIDGKRVSMMSAEEIAAAEAPLNPPGRGENESTTAPLNPSGRGENEPTKDLQDYEGGATNEAAEPNDEKSALARIPMDEETKEPRYEDVDADTAWDAIVEQTNGDKALAQEVVDDTVNEMSAGIEKAEKAISKATFKGKGIQERIAFAKDKQERMAALASEKEKLSKWKRIAAVERMRAAAVEAEKSRAASAERKARQEEEEKARLAREEAERKEREALNGVPNITEDKPSDARARGYRRVDGHKVDRQAPVKAVKGKEVQVKFDDKNIPAGHVAVVDASELQPSHIGGQRNAKHFIDEAQPKERKDDASVEAARKIASNIRPEEITTSVTAYTGAPTVNSRGEVIQGNNRSAALKEMWASHPEQGARYKQYLKEHAAEYGLTAEDIDKVQSPVLVNMLDVSDADAIALGQFVASDTESGGTERLKPKNVTKKLGGRMKTFSNILLRSSDDESSFSELLDRNGMETLKWLNGIGAITPTQYKSSFDSKGNLTAEAKNDLKGVLYQYVFEGGSTQLEEMFNGLPAKAQRAILSTAYRDYESVKDERMIEEIQDSIMAYHALSQDAQFMSATNHKDARAAVESWKRQYAIDDVTGESYLPSEKFSNFTLLLAAMYKGDTQSYIQAKFNAMYDLIQGVREDTLFGTPDNTPRTLAEAINEILNIDYDGQQRSDVLVGGNQVSQARETGSPAGAERGEQSETGEQPTDSGAGTEGDTGKQVAHKDNTLFQYFTGSLADMIARAKLSATDFAKKVLAPVSSRLKEDLQAHGVKLDGDFNHVIDNAAIRHTLKQHGGKNEEKRGQIPITDADFGRIPDVVENYDEITVADGKRGDVNIIYSRTYEDGTTVFVEEKREKRKELAAVTMWKKQSPTLTDANRENTTPISDLSETSSGGKDTNNLDTKQENEEKVVSQAGEPLSEKIESASEDVDTAPTEAQKEAGNYKKGHVQVGKFDITIEQPRGSIRKGTDANGKAWESKMHNTYGYIRGTVGVDGDHIDVFLSNDIDGWDGRKVYVVDQYNPDGSFDEHKVMLGFNDMDKAKSDYLANYEKGWEKGRRIDVSAMDLEDFEKWIASSKRKTKPFAKYAGLKKKDSQGNPLNADGTLKLEKVKSVDDLTDEDFSKPTRSVELPSLPSKVDDAIGAKGKPVIIKKNILEKNYKSHPDLTPNQSREILESALYRPDLYGNNQKTKRPYNWVVINTTDEAGHNRLVLLEVNKNKDNVEIVHWHYIRDNALGTLKKQAEREGGLILILPSEQSEEAGGLSSRTPDLSSDGKDSKVSDTKQEKLSENDRANLAELSDFAVDTDSAKRTAVDAAGFDSEALTIPLLVDGKPSRLSVATIVPAVITDRPYQTAVYDYSDDIDDKTNSGWQKWEDLSDEYNSKVSEEERASVFGDSAELHFKTVDAAVKFDDWLRSGRIEKQQSADELRNDTAAKQLATNAVLDALGNAGISVEVVSDEAASEMLGRNEAKAESNNKEDLGTADHVQFMRTSSKKKSASETASPDNQDQPTVVSSADGANILKSLDGEIKKYENISSYPKTFIGDVSKALGAKRQGSASEYASFETKSGKTVTIRLSNHNAKVSTFDAHDEAEGISIVVTPKENKGISNDGNAHVTEFYYNAIKLRRADGKPLVEILKSIKQALYSGAYTDNTGLAEVKEVNVPAASDGQTDSGKVYGWTVGGKIFLTKDGINPNTPIHEYTHLWAEAMRQRNAKGWQSVKNLLKGTPIWNEVLNDPNYRAISGDEDAVASEALSRISGRENAKKMEAEAQRVIDEADSIGEKAEAVSLLDRMRRALDAFWRWVGKNLFEIKKFESIEEVTDRVLYDLTTGTDLQNDRSLMAVHNISVDKLESALELGGFPMPSIAITNANMGHAGYGEISLVFGKESVDPSDSRNKVYSGDAWTPTFPQIGYKLNEKKTNEIYKRANEVGSLPLFNPVHFHPDNYEGKIDRRGDASLVDRFKEDYGAKQMYLAEKGNAVRAFVQHEVQKYSPEKVSLYKKILETIGLERLKNDSLDSVKNDLTALGINGKSPKYYERIILCAIDYAEHGNSKIENDIDATKQEIDKRIDGKSFSAWLENLFDGVVEKKGIRNERDMFTPSGNSRKWESLYDAVTLDNVIKSMQRQAKKGGEGFFNSSIFGASTKELPSIDAVRREAKLRINSIPDEKMEKAKRRIIERLEKVRIPSVEKGVADAFDFVDNVISAVSASHSPSGIYKYLHAYYPDMTMDAAKEISDIVGEIQKMSAKYFEAKPYRAVGFDEVRAAVVPNDVPREIIDGLRKRGVKVVSYEKGNEQERKDALSSVTHEMDIRFQIKGKDEVDTENGERHREDVEEVNEQYNSELAGLTEENADTKIFNLGRPSSILLSAGVEDKPMKLYGNKVVKKMKKHGFALDELRNLPKAVADPIAVFNNYQRKGNRTILTELRSQGKNIMVAVTLGKNGVDVDFNIVSSVFGKGSSNIVDWINKGYITYVDKEKALHYLYLSAPIAEAAENIGQESSNYLNFSERGILEAAENSELSSATKIVENFENLNVSDENVLRERHGSNGDEDISLSHDPMSKLLGESAYTDAQRKAFGERERKRMATHVSELSEKLNLDNVDVVTDASTLSGNRRRAKGFFNKKTGRITIVIPNHTDMADVEKTLLHEAVAHYGLRKLFGDNFDNFLDNVYRNAEYDIRERIARMASNHGWDVRTATEEYLAGLAEDTNFENMPNGFWSKIKQFFLQMLHSLGFKNLTGVAMGDNELRYVLWRSYENLKEPGRYRNFFTEAADVAKQHQLKVGAYGVSDRADRANVADRADKGENARKETTLASMKQSVAELFEKAKTGEFVGKPASIGRLCSEGKAYLEKLSGLQFKEFVDFVLNPSDLNHIRSNHYGENEKDKSNNVPLTDADIQNMVDVLNAPDAILYGIDKNDGRKLFFFLKDAGNGLYNLTEVCSTKKGNLTAKSFFKTKKKGISQRVMEIKSSLLPTSVTYSGESLSSSAKIPTFFENSKIEEDYSVRDGANEADGADKADLLYRSGVERTVERVPDLVVSQLYEDAVKDTRDRTLLGALVRTWSKDGRTRFKNKFAESYFDYSRSVKALQDAIAKATGRKVEWFEDVWKSLNAKSSIDEREQEVMSRTLAIPLSRHISSMVRQSGGKYDLDAIEAYLNVKHGLERNELMARRAAEEAAEEAYGAEMEQCRKALAADALDTTAEERLQELTSQYDAMVEESYAANRRDYAGLTALFDPEKEGKSLEELEDAARKYISEIEGYYDADTVGGLWDKVRALNNFSLQKSYECGLLSKKQYDDVSKMYKWYVPLRGWHDNYAGDVYNYVNRGADRGMIENAVKKAYGRTSRAGNILGTMSAMANSAIVVGNKNKVAQVFMNLALNHEDTGMFTISEAWYEKNEADDSWRIVTPDNRIHEGMTAEEVADTITKWEDEMREKAANGKALMRSGKFAKDFRHNLEAWKEQQHCVRVSRGGKEYLVYVNGNPRATQAINGLLNPDYQPGIAENLLQKYMRHLARVQTSWSLKFVMSNVQRDVLTATGSAYAKNGAGYALQFEQNFAMNSKDIFGLFYKDLHGSLDMGNAKERMFKEFLDNGGKTGISAIGKKQEYEEKYNKSIYRAMHPASSAVTQGVEGIVHSVEFMNNCIENLTRFSTYMTSRQMGKSIKDAIFDAKECSVNFNMKGSGAWGNATLRKYFLYTNPALQALRMLNSWYEANSVRTVGMLASGVAMGFMVAMVNALCNGGDGDENAYYGLSDYYRYNYFNIGIGNRKFLHWRLPQEMASLYALGHISYDRMTGRISTERAIQMSLEQLNNYSPLSLIEGNPNYDQSADNTYAKTFLKAITPSYLSPFTDAFLWDEDFLGRSIGNRNEWNKRKPEWQRVDKRTPEWFIKPFEAIGKATGSNGSDRKGITNSPVFNPSAWWYVLMQQGGGLAQVGEQAFNACAVVLGSKDADDMELKDYPLVSTVLVDAGTDNARMRIKNERFWMYRSEYEANKATISSINHARNLSPVEKAEKTSSIQDSRYNLMDFFMKTYYKPLHESITEAEANGDKAETKRLKDRLNAVKGMLLKRIEEASPSPSKGGEKAPL